MRREIMLAEIRLNLDDFANAPDAAGVVDEPFSEQFPRDEDSVAVVKWARQFGHGGMMSARFNGSQSVFSSVFEGKA
jgi:hypothetical protein